MASGDVYRVVFQWELFGYAVENVFHFGSSAGWDNASDVATEMANNFNDQWRQWHIDEQRLRKVHVKKLVGTPSEYIWNGTFPYFHGARSDHVSDPRLAATMVFGNGTTDRHMRSRIYYGALNDTMMDFGKVNENAHSNLDGLLIWLSTNYGNPGTTFLHHLVFSRSYQLTFPTDPSQWFDIVRTYHTSFRIAVIHSRRTGAGI